MALRLSGLAYGFILLLAAGGCDLVGREQGTSIRGVVLDAQTEAPLAGIHISLSFGGQPVADGETRPDGSFALIDVDARAIGYSYSRPSYSFFANPGGLNRAYNVFSSSPSAGHNEVTVRLEPTTR